MGTGLVATEKRYIEMAEKKKYADASVYETKLKNIMKRLGVEKYDYDWSRKTAYVQFIYKNQPYRFEHSVEKANALGKVKLTYGTDVFAQIVLALEDLARMIERGIYDLDVWIAGMKYLPEKKQLPACFGIFGFAGPEPPSEEELQTRYKECIKEAHPDNGGDFNKFIMYQNAMHQCAEYIKKEQEP